MKFEKSHKNLDKTPIVTQDHLATAVSLKTGIPVSKVQGSEQELLVNLEKHLSKSIIGQKEAINVISKAIRRGRSGITDTRRPIGSFIFMGPTGVGKTELAKVLAREVFGGDNSLIKIDDDGGKLTEQIRRHPYSVVLFDEIEKAHPEVFNILLQILEDGSLTDGQGNKVKFNNSIIILTSNLGAEDMYRESELGFSAKTKKNKADLKYEHEMNKESALRALKRTMRPELINRFDAIVTFNALTHDDVNKIFDILIEDLKKRLSAKSVGLKLSTTARNHLIKKGFDPKNGARPLRRIIEDELESLIADKLLDGELKEGQIASIGCAKDKLTFAIGKE